MSVETLLAIFLHQTSTGLGSRKKNIVHNSKAQDGSLNRAVNSGAGAFIPMQSHRKYSFLLSAILEKGGRYKRNSHYGEITISITMIVTY